MPTDRTIIVVCLGEVPKDIEADWNRWYDTVHIPARLALPGFIGVRRFATRAGEWRYLSVYEIESLQAVRSDGYQALKRHELSLPATSLEARTLRLPHLMRGVYRQLDPDHGDAVPDTATLTMVTHEVPPGREAEFHDWYRHEHLPRLRRDPDIADARRFERAEWPGAPASQASIPRFLTLHELRSAAALEGEACRQAAVAPFAGRMAKGAALVTRLAAADAVANTRSKAER